MPTAAIRFENVTKRYRIGASRYRSLREDLSHFFKKIIGKGGKPPEILALDNVSFEVRKGEALGIIGPNGAGKTTILKLIAKVTKPISGKISVNGRVASLIEIGAGFHPELTGRENIFLYGSIMGMKQKEIKDKFDEIVSFAELEKFIDTPVKRYSSGMYARLGFSVAAYVDPDILLVDEVLAVGDISFQRKCIEKMLKVTSQGITVLFVSHNMHLVTAVAKKAIFLQKGMVDYSGEAEEAIKRYLEKMREISEEKEMRLEKEIPQVADKKGTIINLMVNRSTLSIPTIQMDDELCIYVQYRVDKTIRDPHFAITIWTDYGVLVTFADSRFDLEKINFSTQGTIECRFPALKLLPGKYYVKAYLLDGVTNWIIDSFGWLDGRICGFWVKEQLIKLNTGITAALEQIHHGLVLTPVQWNTTSDILKTDKKENE